jgi:dipeptidyl aminopeptidase/acylaminoacyl peptidase
MRRIGAVSVVIASIAAADPVHASDWTAALSSRLGLKAEPLEVAGRPAFLLAPSEEKRQTPQPWIMYAPALPDYPDAQEAWMHRQFVAAGVAVAGVDAGEAYGSPRGQAAMEALYKELVEHRGYAARPCLLGRSRGGLWILSWAAKHPDQVAGIAGIYPAFDLRTYPGLDKAAPAYELTPDALKSELSKHNPIEQAASLAKARAPAYFIHGADDIVVPLKENSAEFAVRYKASGAGDVVTVNVIKGQGHNFWEGFFHCQELVDFAVKQAKAGAEKSK